jgi:hypothetical protein
MGYYPGAARSREPQITPIYRRPPGPRDGPRYTYLPGRRRPPSSTMPSSPASLSPSASSSSLVPSTSSFSRSARRAPKNTNKTYGPEQPLSGTSDGRTSAAVAWRDLSAHDMPPPPRNSAPRKGSKTASSCTKLRWSGSLTTGCWLVRSGPRGTRRSILPLDLIEFEIGETGKPH